MQKLKTEMKMRHLSLLTWVFPIKHEKQGSAMSGPQHAVTKQAIEKSMKRLEVLSPGGESRVSETHRT